MENPNLQEVTSNNVNDELFELYQDIFEISKNKEELTDEILYIFDNIIDNTSILFIQNED